MELLSGWTWGASASTVGSALCGDLEQAELRLETDGVAAAACSSWAGDVRSVQDFGGSVPEVPIPTLLQSVGSCNAVCGVSRPLNQR